MRYIARFPRVFAAVAGLALLLSAACSKSPTTAQPDGNNGPAPLQPEISIVCSPTSGGKDTEVTVTVSIKENEQDLVNCFKLTANCDESFRGTLEAAEHWSARDLSSEISKFVKDIFNSSEDEL